ncbi:MAG: sulfur carrier protein ThiS [Alphaproteobacteria bacterium]|nr:sulfur carrier protein ThiS [Alphaproteobacteria bacterium]
MNIVIEITINGDPHKIAKGQNLDMLLQDLNLDPAKVAVERNLEIVSKTTYQDVIIMADDRLEIVHFIGGGK